MPTTLSTNGLNKPRKSLANQLDRLDHILDGLSDAIPDVVASAIRDSITLAVRQAVQETLKELLQHPELIRRLAPQPTPKKQTYFQRTISWLGTTLKAFSSKVVAIATDVRLGLVTGSQVLKNSCQRAVQGIRNHCSVLIRFHMLFLSALLVGTAVGVVSFYAGPWLSAVVSGIGGFATALLVKVGIWLRGVFKNSGAWSEELIS